MTNSFAVGMGQTAKKSWLGCGKHIPTALSGVPEADWCTCEPKVEVDGQQYPPAALKKSRKEEL